MATGRGPPLGAAISWVSQGQMEPVAPARGETPQKVKGWVGGTVSLALVTYIGLNPREGDVHKPQLLLLPYRTAIFGAGALDLRHVTTKVVTLEQVGEVESDFQLKGPTEVV